jgi:Sec-independent protein translocase protein TatA
MFGVGPQELLIVALLFLVVFGPGKAAGMARDFGRLVSGANRTVEEFKSEILSEEVEEARRTVETFRDGAATQASSESRNGDDEGEELDL